MHSLIAQLEKIMPTALCGCVVRTDGATTAVAGFPAPVGSLVEIERQGSTPVCGEVIGFREALTLVYPLGEMTGVRFGSRVRLAQTSRFVRVGEGLLGRVIDARGRPLDGIAEPLLRHRLPLHRLGPAALERPRIDSPLATGIRAIDGLLTCGRGQRMGIFAGAGVGKSVLLGMMARATAADVNVIALIGERGREVNEFIQNNLGCAGLRKSVVVVATSDEPAMMRVEAALLATTVAEYFRDQGQDVLLAMDSVTRFAAAQREIGLAAGEPPTTRGYPPSTFAALPRLLERAGRAASGSITAFYTVLVEGDDLNEPVSDAVRSLLDGHIVLSRKLAAAGHYPAIDPLASISRLAPAVTSPAQQAAGQRVRALLAAHRDHEDLISVGAYRPGSNPLVDQALARRDSLARYLRQDMHELCDWEDSRAGLLRLAEQAA